MGAEFVMHDEQIKANLAKLRRESRAGVEGAFRFQGARSEAYMKTAAPWTDRTSAARNGLHTTVGFSRREMQLVLAHAVSYGIWLEVANSGHYQVILPALRLASVELQHLLHNLWGKI